MFLSILLSIVISTTLDSTQLSLGDQTKMVIEATCDNNEYVNYPHFGKQLTEGVEIVRQSEVDSTIDKLGKHYKQELVLTSFEDSLFFIDPLPFISGGDTAYSDPLTLNFIQPFVLDSTNTIFDIRDIEKAPIWWWGYIRWILGILLLIGIGVLVWWLLGKIGRYDGTFIAPIRKEPERPAEEVALEQLDRIREEKIWTQGHTKQYHTELTDVLRTYIAGRFGVASTEKTSDETLLALKPILSDQRELHASLSKVLRLADLVKFAKWQTTPDENEQALTIAYEFVNETKPVAPKTDADNSDLPKE